MIAPHGHGDPDAREIARGLAAAVAALLAVAHEPGALAWTAATDIADLLQLPGLAALLGVCRAHAAHPPAEVTNALERLSRLAAQADAEGSLAAFTASDRELDAIAGAIGSQTWAPASSTQAPPVPLQSLAELLSDLQVDDRTPLESCMIAMPVAAGLRAALDWLGAGASGPIRVTLEDAVVTLGFQVEHEPGLAPAGSVLSLTGGALLRVSEDRWSIRVPLHTDRPAFLLARQGALTLAVPWHAVARLRLATESARAGFAESSLAPWSPLERQHGERPAVLLAQGLQHAWLHVDHIVWRVFASPDPAIGPPEMPGVRLCVHTPDGEDWWVVAPVEALRDVPPIVTPPTRPRRREPIEHRHDSHVGHDVVEAPVPEVQLAPSIASRTVVDIVEPSPRLATAAPGLVVLGRQHVRALEYPRPAVARVEPQRVVPTPAIATLAPVAEPAPPLATQPLPAPEADPEPKPRRALIADDSLVARLAIARVLQAQGWDVEMVERASEMWQALEEGGYAAVFVDVALPDARGREHLRELVARQLVTDARFELIALPRDGAEERVVRECGIARALRKPFARGAVEALVGALRPADPA